MNQNRLQEINELEQNFKKLAASGHPYVMDNGFFVDAVFNVLQVLKERYKQDEPLPTNYVDDKNKENKGDDKSEEETDVRTVLSLYNCLKNFEQLYTSCLGYKYEKDTKAQDK